MCSGVSLGASHKMAHYIFLMSSIMMGKSDLSNLFPKCEGRGVDQGAHNVIMALGLIQNSVGISETISHHIGSPFMNLQSSGN